MAKPDRTTSFAKSTILTTLYIISFTRPMALLDKQRSIKNMEKALSSLFLSILRTVNERKDHIPPITTSDGNPFPYQVPIATHIFNKQFILRTSVKGSARTFCSD